METCSFCNKESPLLTIVQFEQLIFICQQCIGDLRQRQSDIERYMSPEYRISKSNDVCKKCFLSEPTHIKVTLKKFTKVCSACIPLIKKQRCSCNNPLSCKEHFKAGKSAVFIKIKWKNYLKSRDDLRDYNNLKNNMKKIKEIFEKKNNEIHKMIENIDNIKSGLKDKVRNSILEKKSQINKYKDDVKILFSGISKQIKEHELIGKYSKYYRLLESDIRQDFFSQNIMETQKVSNLKSELEERFCLKLTSPATIFS